MQFWKFRPIVLTSTLLLLAAGCESPWYMAEPAADALIPPTNPWSCEMSRKDLAGKVGKPADVQFFGDRAQYMGDENGNRYVHVREMSEFWGFLGECVYAVPASQWPMAHPMPLTLDATKWQDVTWMGCDGPEGVTQNAFLQITPTFALGAPQTQPASNPPPTGFSTQPATDATPSTPPTPATGVGTPATTDSATQTTPSQPAFSPASPTQPAPIQPDSSSPAPAPPVPSPTTGAADLTKAGTGTIILPPTPETAPATTVSPTTQPSLNK